MNFVSIPGKVDFQIRLRLVLASRSCVGLNKIPAHDIQELIIASCLTTCNRNNGI